MLGPFRKIKAGTFYFMYGDSFSSMLFPFRAFSPFVSAYGRAEAQVEKPFRPS